MTCHSTPGRQYNVYCLNANSNFPQKKECCDFSMELACLFWAMSHQWLSFQDLVWGEVCDTVWQSVTLRNQFSFLCKDLRQSTGIFGVATEMKRLFPKRQNWIWGHPHLSTHQTQDTWDWLPFPINSFPYLSVGFYYQLGDRILPSTTCASK